MGDDYIGVSYSDPDDGEIISFDYMPGEEIADVIEMYEVTGEKYTYYRIYDV